MRKVIVIFAILVLTHVSAFAQDKVKSVTVKGVVTDEADGTPLDLVLITTAESLPEPCITDSLGQFSLEVPAGKGFLKFSKEEYNSSYVKFHEWNDTTLNVSMTKTTWKDYLKLGRAFELDIKLAFVSYGVTNIDHLAHTMLGAEFRYNFKRLPVDVGLSGSWSVPFSMEPVEAGKGTPIGSVITYSYWNILAFSDYNFFNDKKFSPYLGLGLGGGKSDSKILEGFDPDSNPERPVGIYGHAHKPIATFAIRAGFEINHIWRVALEEHFNSDGSRGFHVTFAIIIPRD